MSRKDLFYGAGLEYGESIKLMLCADVWISNGAAILSGVTVGDGAVIGADAVVTKNVPPYAVVAGNPARIIKYRFDEKTIEKLLELKWWDWDYEKIYDAIPILQSGDIEELFKLR